MTEFFNEHTGIGVDAEESYLLGHKAPHPLRLDFVIAGKLRTQLSKQAGVCGARCSTVSTESIEAGMRRYLSMDDQQKEAMGRMAHEAWRARTDLALVALNKSVSCVRSAARCLY